MTVYIIMYCAFGSDNWKLGSVHTSRESAEEFVKEQHLHERSFIAVRPILSYAENVK